MLIEELPLPRYITDWFKSKGYTKLYPPQEEAIRRGLLEGKNLIITTPTASGKTFTAILAIVNVLLKFHNSKVIYLVPLKALANEKLREFKELLNFRINNRAISIAISTGDYDTPGEELKNADIIIATNERMDSILRHSPQWIRKIKLVIADEGHLIGVSDRGPVLESILTKLKIEFNDVQIIVLSATLKNKDDFSRWLNAEIIESDWRPIPLKEGVLYDHMEVFPDGSIIEVSNITGDPILDNAYSTILSGGQVIIFTQTRREAVTKAKRYAEFMKYRISKIFTRNEIEDLKYISKQILESSEITELSRSLADVMRVGVAFHHAGLNPVHREIIEETFKNKLIKILTATPTLAAGVNLPSRKVIITYTSRRGLGGFEENISVFEYKQMAGRAGRPGYDDLGISLIFVKYKDLVDIVMNNYVRGEIEPITSHLLEGENLEAQLLGLITTYRSANFNTISKFISNTLCAIQKDKRYIYAKLEEAINSLIEKKLILYDDVRGLYVPTPLGRRASELYILPSTAKLFKDVSLRVANDEVPDILLLYYISKSKDMDVLPIRRGDRRLIYDRLNILMKNYAVEYNSNLSSAIKRFFDYIYDENELSAWKCALVLHDWIEERSEDDILRIWHVEPGDLYVIKSNAEWLSYAASEISKLFKNYMLSRKYSILQHRIRYGIKEELLEIASIPGIGRRRARILYNYGYRRLCDFKTARLEDLISIPGIGVKLAEKILKETQNLNA